MNRVKLVSATLIVALLMLTTTSPDLASDVFSSTQEWIIETVSWVYVLAVAAVLMTVIYLAMSKSASVKLGYEDPEFSRLAWFSMLFAAGMGIGLLFFGVAEPVMHYQSPPTGDPGTVEAAKNAMKITFFHWGLHAWGVYAIVGLSLAYFSYNKGLPLTIRSMLYPVLGSRIKGKLGDLIDTFAVVSTVLGIATSLGLGVLQVNSGLNYLFGVDVSMTTQLILVVVATMCATLSVASGLSKGIRLLSLATITLSVALLSFIIVSGPTTLLINSMIQNTGAYLGDLVVRTFNLYAYEKSDWIGGWTLFYWGWWISWSPFVGMFIARISKGRTVREFVAGVLLVPVGFTILWMTTFGNSALDLIRNKGASDLAAAVQSNSAIAIFKFLEYYPLGYLLSLVAMVMVMLYFVTSADSGSLVVDTIASGGAEGSTIIGRSMWSISIGLVALALLYNGGLTSLQTATIAGALPFSIILLLTTYGLMRELNHE